MNPRPTAKPDAVQGDTLPSRGEKTEPRLPHEHDESADSQTRVNAAAKAIGDKAFADVKAGRVDTDRGPEMDRAYKAQRGAPRTPSKASAAKGRGPQN